eukprot:5587510-Amphidinium_carterae.1
MTVLIGNAFIFRAFLSPNMCQNPAPPVKFGVVHASIKQSSSSEKMRTQVLHTRSKGNVLLKQD